MKLSQISKFRKQRSQLTYVNNALRKRLKTLRLIPKLSSANLEEIAGIKMMLTKVRRQLANLSKDRHQSLYHKL